VTGDRVEHHLLDRPRQRPVRTALGVATISFYAVCFLGGGSDVLAATFGLSVNAVLWTFRVLVLVAPPITGWITYLLCRELADREGLPIASRVRVRDIPRLLFRGAPTSSSH
jgi:ubiquinol-cytochrome c reductase cytochrome b subunit